MSLSVTLLGTRGSIPTPGPSTIRYGGNTPCLLVQDDRGNEVILDAGTGIRPFGQRMLTDGFPPRVLILLTHTHWDHIQGLPFFAPVYQPGVRVEIRGPAPEGVSLRGVLEAQMSAPVFPIPVVQVTGRLAVSEIEEQTFEAGNLLVDTVPLCHPGATLGYSLRQQSGGKAVTYMTDNELRSPKATRRRAGFVQFLQGTEVLIHDAMYFESEIDQRAGWGHSSAADAVLLALEAGVDRLVLFHHDPGHDDAALERLLEEAEECRVRHGGTLDVTIAAEGSTIRCQEEDE